MGVIKVWTERFAAICPINMAAINPRGANDDSVNGVNDVELRTPTFWETGCLSPSLPVFRFGVKSVHAKFGII